MYLVYVFRHFLCQQYLRYLQTRVLDSLRGNIQNTCGICKQ